MNMHTCPTCGAPILAPNQVSVSLATGEPHACFADLAEKRAQSLRAELLGAGDSDTDAAVAAWSREVDALTTVPMEWQGGEDK